MSKTTRVYKIIFHNQGKIYELYTRHVGQSTMMGFVEIEGLIFGERSSVVVDPTEEKLQSEFAGVTRAYIPLHSVIRIDEVEKEGSNKIHDSATDVSNVATFPSSHYTPPRKT